MEPLTLVAVVVGLLFLAGVVGAVIPWVPGPLFVLAGALIWALATEFATLGVGRLVILAALAASTFVLGLVTGALGAQRYGASRWGVLGALVGGIVGILLGPLGLLFGSVAGAVAGELLRGADVAGGLRSGFGAVVGLLVGLVADLLIVMTMIALFLWWTWR